MIPASQSKTMREYVALSGFADYSRIIHLFIGGSELHGAKLEGTDDHDIYGVFIEPPEVILGTDAMQRDHQHFVWSTAGNDQRNTADDVDITLFSLQKWAYLACKGNLTKMHFLFAQNLVNVPVSKDVCTTTWTEIVRHRDAFLAKSHLDAIVHFSDDQLMRLTGEKGRGKKGQRPELEMKHGYDTKAAMHALRILYEGKELMETGRISLPGPQKNALIDIRKGKWSLEEVLKQAEDVKHECLKAQANSPLPDELDRPAVNRTVAEAYQSFWQWKSDQ
jgi:predicted nucleotidyltransferase